MKTSIIMPVYNQLEVTKICVESIKRNTASEYELIAVDNASDSPAAQYLETVSSRVIRNDINKGCAGAWNQGLRASVGEYVCIINNDVVVTPGWLERLREFYSSHSFGLVSPAMREGPLDYDPDELAERFTSMWAGKFLRGEYLGVCFFGARKIFDTVGNFDEHFRYGKFEDEDFYFRMKEKGMDAAVTFSVLIHHFGSKTIDVQRKESGDFEKANRAYFNRKWKRLYLSRKLRKRRLRKNACLIKKHIEEALGLENRQKNL